jgi:benzodiazapine receptor
VPGGIFVPMKTNTKLLQVTNIVAFLAVMVVNTLATTVGLLGWQTGALSDNIPNLFVPAGLTFSVWGVIYLALLLFTVYQARGLFSANRPAPEALGRVGWLFFVSSVANVGWLLLWHAQLVALSMIPMLILLVTLIAVHVRLGTGRTRPTGAERWFFRVPFSLYLGWITVATVANATAALVTAGWNGFGLAPEVWAVVLVVVAALVTLVMLLTRRDAAYGLVVVWALAGIALKRSADESAASQAVYIAAVACAAVVAAGIVVTAVRTALRPLKD